MVDQIFFSRAKDTPFAIQQDTIHAARAKSISAQFMQTEF
jgi:hypothetical protein